MPTTHSKQVSFRFTATEKEALEFLKRRDGIPYSEQLRRGLQLWIASKRVPTPARRGRSRE